jgi:Mg-chelatase subunit ChlI
VSKAKPTTLGELRAAGWRSRTVKQEIRDNLLARLKVGDTLFPGVVGYERTVIPGIVNALLAHHDFILLGLRGQAKTRLLRSLVTLLDDLIPVLAGTPLNDDPLRPASTSGLRLVEEAGDDAPIEWLPREARYNEKLATPDVTIADLIGDVDPIKAATRRLTYADPEVIPGIVPHQSRHLRDQQLPDLAPRIQVGLLSILEERDIQVRGFPLRIPLDILMVFSANPEDYTNRGTIITPLKDRISSQILTHYPTDVEHALEITRQEAWTRRDGPHVVVPRDVELLIEEVSVAARQSELVDQSSGVSARVAIAATELLQSTSSDAPFAPGMTRVAAPDRPPDAAAGDHRQGRDGLRGEQQGPRSWRALCSAPRSRSSSPRASRSRRARRRGRGLGVRAAAGVVRRRQQRDALRRVALCRPPRRAAGGAGSMGARRAGRRSRRGARLGRGGDPRGAAPARAAGAPGRRLGGELQGGAAPPGAAPAEPPREPRRCQLTKGSRQFTVHSR